jgi:ribose transport system substrate-binding protein
MLPLFGCSKSGIAEDDKLILDSTEAVWKDPDSSSISKTKIALIVKTLTNPFFIDMEKGARKAEAEFGINLIVRTAAQETSIEQQISIVNDIIEEKVDAIIITPSHSTEFIPVLKKAQDAGIVIVNIDNRIDPEVAGEMGLVNMPYISVDNEEAAYRAAKHLSSKIGKPTEVCIIEGIRGAENSKQRKNGILRAFKENRNINVVAVETANWKIDDAYSVTDAVFSKYPEIGAVYCANDMMALGTVEYLKKAGRSEVLVGGFDALKEAREAIAEGRMLVTVDQQAEQQGYLGVKAALGLIRGEPVQMETYIPVKIINAGKTDE